MDGTCCHIYICTINALVASSVSVTYTFYEDNIQITSKVKRFSLQVLLVYVYIENKKKWLFYTIVNFY